MNIRLIDRVHLDVQISGKSTSNFSIGAAQYVNDIPLIPGELQAVFVCSNVGNAKLKSIDASKALVRHWKLRFF
jgi:xanthine dehydrogenase molybdopterin-binding subunit B